MSSRFSALPALPTCLQSVMCTESFISSAMPARARWCVSLLPFPEMQPLIFAFRLSLDASSHHGLCHGNSNAFPVLYGVWVVGLVGDVEKIASRRRDRRRLFLVILREDCSCKCSKTELVCWCHPLPVKFFHRPSRDAVLIDKDILCHESRLHVDLCGKSGTRCKVLECAI